MSKNISIHWFRQDLRIQDNPALNEASADHVMPIYILDTHEIGAASKCWLYHSLTALNKSLGNKLNVYKGDASKIILDLSKKYCVKNIYWNRCYEPTRIKQDTQIKELLKNNNYTAKSFNGSLLWEPWETLKKDATPYKVFTPFFKNLYEKIVPRKIIANIKTHFIKDTDNSLSINELDLLPKIHWDKKIIEHWSIGEKAAQNKLANFLENGLKNYKEGRDFPYLNTTSKLSPYLHFGEISPNQIWHAVLEYAQINGYNNDIEHFLRELVWREFSYNLLYYFKDLPSKNLQPKFNDFAWQHNKKYLQAWQKGLTGYPIIDAGMRELWQTGYMHNRVRMIVGSFLVKNLLIHWHYGQKWFFDCLVDADLANNSASWQWVAGCGADAAPYFRIFNPITQGQKFDKDGYYIKKYLPELQNLDNKYIFAPWLAPPEALRRAQIKLGQDYPNPIIDIALSRKIALDAYFALKN